MPSTSASTRSRLLLSRLLLSLLSFAITAPPAQAHIEKGFMPDSVAEMEYRILLDFQPEDIKTRNLLGMALLRLNKLKESETEFRQALKTKPDDFDATDSLGLVLLKQGKPDEALPLTEKAVTMRPGDCLAQVHLGQAREAAGKPDAAEQAYLAAQANCANDASAGAADRKKEADQALAAFRAKHEASPTKAATDKP